MKEKVMQDTRPVLDVEFFEELFQTFHLKITKEEIESILNAAGLSQAYWTATTIFEAHLRFTKLYRAKQTDRIEKLYKVFTILDTLMIQGKLPEEFIFGTMEF